MKTRILRMIVTLLVFLLTSSYAFADYIKTLVPETALESPASIWNAGDDSTKTVDIGFDFPFGSALYASQVHINSNGGLAIDAGWSVYNNSTLPITAPPQLIAPYWDDINPSSGGNITYGIIGSTPNRRFIVAWNNTPRFGQSGGCTFQTVLYEDGTIRFRYSAASINCDGSSATIGIQESNQQFIQHSFNNILDYSQDILFTPTGSIPPIPATPPVLAVGRCDNFEYNLANWTLNETPGLISRTTATSQSTNHSLSINGGVANATSIPVNTSNYFKELTIWVRRGSSVFSEAPDNNENLAIEYYSSGNAWVALETFTGSGTRGQIFTRTYPMPNNAKHNNFRVRLRMTGGSGASYDFWHIDDVCLVQQTGVPAISLQKTSAVISDGINITHPKRIPSAVVEYTITATNTGTGVTDDNSVVITDVIPSNTQFVTGSLVFLPGSSGMVADESNFSYSVNGAVYTQTPPDAVISHIRVNPQNIFNSSGTFQIRFKVVID